MTRQKNLSASTVKKDKCKKSWIRQMDKQSLRPLSMVKAGETVKLFRINAGQGLNSRLASMGLVTNVKIKVVSNCHPGPFVVSVKNSKIVLGRGMAHKIMVV